MGKEEEEFEGRFREDVDFLSEVLSCEDNEEEEDEDEEAEAEAGETTSPGESFSSFSPFSCLPDLPTAFGSDVKEGSRGRFGGVGVSNSNEEEYKSKREKSGEPSLSTHFLACSKACVFANSVTSDFAASLHKFRNALSSLLSSFRS